MSVICSNSYNFGITKVISCFWTSFQTGIRVCSYDWDDNIDSNVGCRENIDLAIASGKQRSIVALVVTVLNLDKRDC